MRSLFIKMLEIYKTDVRANYIFPISSVKQGIKAKSIPPKALIFGGFFAIPLLLCAFISFVLRSIAFIFKFLCNYAEVLAETKSPYYWALVAAFMPFYIINFALTLVAFPFRIVWLWGWGMMLASGFLESAKQALQNNDAWGDITKNEYWIE